MQELADVADLSEPTIYRIETARYSATLDVLASLAQALEVPLAELVSFPVAEAGDREVNLSLPFTGRKGAGGTSMASGVPERKGVLLG